VHAALVLGLLSVPMLMLMLVSMCIFIVGVIIGVAFDLCVELFDIGAPVGFDLDVVSMFGCAWGLDVDSESRVVFDVFLVPLLIRV